MTGVSSQSLMQLFPRAEDVPSEHRLPDPLIQRRILIDGVLEPWPGPVREVRSPIRLRDAEGVLSAVVVGSHPLCGVAEAERALAAAVAAWADGRGAWPAMPVAERIACMRDFSRRLVARREEVVRLIMWEIGKSFADSAKEFDRTIEYIGATIEALRDVSNAASHLEQVEDTIGQIRRTPLGVVLCMGPYNYPLNETFATLIPALIMGNTVVFKPPTMGILLFAPLLEAFAEAFPKGVINTLYGNGEDVVPPVLASGAIDVLTLIGSSRVADRLKKLHPKVNRLRAILGLDAKNAAIILPDADLDLAVKECLAGALTFNGQRCTALKMLMVHRSIAEVFLSRFSAALAALKVGMPWEAGVALTPLPSPQKVAAMRKHVDDAVAKGARVMNAGGGAEAGTLFFPAVLYPVAEGMSLYREEQFGPVVPVMPFDDVETVLDYIATSDHGQQVSIFGTDPAVIGQLLDPLANQVCRVNLNCQCQRGPDVFPFTGRKDSAMGTLSVRDALNAFSIRSMVAAKQTCASRELIDAIVRDQRSNFLSMDVV